jgi:hypothetical protein
MIVFNSRSLMMKRSLQLTAVLLAAAVSMSLAAADNTGVERLPVAKVATDRQAPADPLAQAARDAVGDDAVRATSAIKRLRAAGPGGLEALVSAHATTIQQALTPSFVQREGKLVPEALSPLQQRLRSAMDSVAMQRDAMASRLYWYTDLQAATAEAARTGKPILSLRMLGKLNEDLSCANSRFFRTTLYANTQVGDYLRDHFILHWESVRPVPVITIDMGDGRKVVRTITGNSIHYVLDARGRVVDALPGLYGAQAFLKALAPAEQIGRAMGPLNDTAFVAATRGYWRDRLNAITTAWNTDLASVGGKVGASTPVKANTFTPAAGTLAFPTLSATPGTPIVTLTAPPTAGAASQLSIGKGKVERSMLAMVVGGRSIDVATPSEVQALVGTIEKAARFIPPTAMNFAKAPATPTAVVAAPVAFGKGMVERPILVRIMPDGKALEAATTDELWVRIAALHAQDAMLDAGAHPDQGAGRRRDGNHPHETRGGKSDAADGPQPPGFHRVGHGEKRVSASHQGLRLAAAERFAG